VGQTSVMWLVPMSNIGQWNPNASTLASVHGQLLSKGARKLESPNLGLSQDELANLRPVIRQSGETWESFIIEQPSQILVDWIKVLTILEKDVSGFELGDKSPVITLYRILKHREELPEDLLSWIKAHSNNRFLPYGSLLNRM